MSNRKVDHLSGFIKYIHSKEWQNETIANSRYPFLIKLFVFFLRLGGRVKLVVWNGFAKHCKENNIEIHICDSACDETSIFYPVTIKGDAIVDACYKTVHFSESFYVELTNVMSLYGTGCIVHSGEILSFKDSHYWISLNHTQNHTVIRYKDNCCCIRREAPERLPNGILLESRWPLNLCHVIYDVMLRLRLVDNAPAYDQWPLLISELTLGDTRFASVVRLFNTKNRKVIPLKTHSNYLIDRAVVPSYLNQSVHHSFNGAQSTTGFLSKTNVLFIQSLLSFDRSKKGTRKFYVYRPNHDRLVNEEEVVSFFSNQGFEIIDPGNMSFLQQIECFSQTRWMVATHGAALSNLPFCPSHAVVVQITSSEIINNVRYENLAFNAGCLFACILAETVEVKFPHLAPGLGLRLPVERCNEIMCFFEKNS